MCLRIEQLPICSGKVVARSLELNLSTSLVCLHPFANSIIFRFVSLATP